MYQFIQVLTIIHFPAAGDYQRVLTTLHFRPDRSPVVVVQIIILDDKLHEGEERLTVELTVFDLSIVLVNSITEIVIQDDDEGMINIQN